MALLAFLGKLSDQHQNKIAVFSSALIVFVSGVLAITIASGITYLSQWFYAHSDPWKRKTGHALNILAILLNLTSYGCFIVSLGEWEKNPRLQAKTLVRLRHGELPQIESYSL